MEEQLWQVVIIVVVLQSVASVEVGNEFAEARVGSDAELPCNLEALYPQDKMTQVVWRKEDEPVELYTYNLTGDRPDHKVNPSLGDRYYMRVVGEDSAVLTIAHIGLGDEATYHCQVDFQKSPTRVTHVNLTVTGKFRPS